MAAGPKNDLARRMVEAADRGREEGYEPVVVPMGPCECPGRPHTDGDEGVIRDRFHWAQARRVVSAVQRGEPGDGEAELVPQGLLSWNLTSKDESGQDQPLPMMRLTVDRLSPAQGVALSTALDQPHYLFGTTLPNVPSEPSADGLAESTSA